MQSILQDPGSTLADWRFILETVAVIVMALFAFSKTVRDRDSANLAKTLEAASDAAARINDQLSKAPDGFGERLGEVIEGGVKKVEDIRGKKLSPTLARKARERIKSLINTPTPD